MTCLLLLLSAVAPPPAVTFEHHVRPILKVHCLECHGESGRPKGVNHYDLQATALHLFGLDHEKLTYRHNGREMAMTDGQAARVVREVLGMMMQPPGGTPFDVRFTLFGTRVVVNPFFWIITLLLAESLFQQEDPMVKITLWVAAVFFSILLHEFGHVWMWRAFGVEAHILLHGWGGLAIADEDTPRRWQRILVSFAGPLIQLLFYAALLGVWLYRRELRDYPSALFFLSALLWINLAWPLLNLLPIYPLDGGQIAREACQMAATRSRTTNSRPALFVSLWISIATAAAATFYILMPRLGFEQPYHLGVGPLTAVMFVLLAVGNFQEMQQMRGRRGPLDDDW